MKDQRALCAFLLLIGGCTCAGGESNDANLFRIAFGSCGKQDQPLAILNDVVEHQPDVFIFLGDNIYGDTDDMDFLREKYRLLGSKASFQNLKEHTEILATWDDHDFGQNDIGKNYPHKEASKRIMLEFFNEPKDSERYRHPGIYHSVYRKAGEKVIQIILLDGRTFRDDLLPATDQPSRPKRFFYELDYAPHGDTSTTLLGEHQWAWLEGELRKPADVRILASGTQFGVEYNGYEAWANFPHEQERLVRLIKTTRADHLIVISGDVHYAEISKFERPDCYPIYDITSSGLSETWKFATPNSNRIEGPVMDNNFGLLTVDLSPAEPRIVAEIWDARGNQRVEHAIPLNEISFPGN